MRWKAKAIPSQTILIYCVAAGGGLTDGVGGDFAMEDAAGVFSSTFFAAFALSAFLALPPVAFDTTRQYGFSGSPFLLFPFGSIQPHVEDAWQGVLANPWHAEVAAFAALAFLAVLAVLVFVAALFFGFAAFVSRATGATVAEGAAAAGGGSAAAAGEAGSSAVKR